MRFAPKPGHDEQSASVLNSQNVARRDYREDIDWLRAIAVLGPFPTAERLRAAQPEFLLQSLRGLPALLKSMQGYSVKPD